VSHKFANWFLGLSVFLSLAAVTVAYAAKPSRPESGCLWLWAGPSYGWIIYEDECFGFCNPPDRRGHYPNEFLATPCLGCE
jgi:hypothetical protein